MTSSPWCVSSELSYYHVASKIQHMSLVRKDCLVYPCASLGSLAVISVYTDASNCFNLAQFCLINHSSVLMGSVRVVIQNLLWFSLNLLSLVRKECTDLTYLLLWCMQYLFYALLNSVENLFPFSFVC